MAVPEVPPVVVVVPAKVAMVTVVAHAIRIVGCEI
jgi:hypothetical protein